MSKRPSAYALTIDDHGLAGDGQVGKFGTCSACGRANKVVTEGEDQRCIMPRLVMFSMHTPATGCDAQKGTRQRTRTRIR